MGLLSNIFKKEQQEIKINEYFETINGYTPTFTSFEGGLYEMELTRAAIHSFATHVSKLKPEMKGAGNQVLERRLQYQPNPFQDTTKFLYRLATIFLVQNNAFIAPLYDNYGDISGYVPLLPQHTRIVEYKGVPYIIYEFNNGKRGAIELERTGILNQFQYRDDFFGESNTPMRSTLDLLHTQNEGIIEGVKQSATLRFMAKLAHVLKNEDIDKERKRFKESNLSADNDNGVLMFDSKYSEVKQIDSKPFIVDAEQMKQIKENVFTYFGTNEDILQNKFTSDKWNAYYEGKIEPFAIQLSLVMTNMTFTQREIAHNNSILFTANRLQYMSNTEKLNTVTQLFDRGFITHNQGLEIFNMAGIGEEGDKRFIRKEYAESNYLNESIEHVEIGGDYDVQTEEENE